jgi:hypothetical protein
MKTLTFSKSIIFIAYLLLVVINVLGSQRVGISWDEPFHTSRLEERLNYGLNIPFDWFGQSFTLPTYAANFDYPVHGLAFQLLSHVFNFLIGNENWLEVSQSIPAVQGRHLISALFGIGASILVGLIYFKITKNLTYSMLTSLLLLSIPVFSGHSMFNPKDIPVSFAITLNAYAIFYFIHHLRGKLVKLSNLVILFALQASWIFIGVGTRFALWIYLLLQMIILFTFYILKRKEIQNLLKLSVFISLGSTVGLILVFILHSDQLLDIKSFFINSLYNSSSFSSSSKLVFLGSISEPPSNRMYIISHILIHVPIIFIIISIFFLTQLVNNYAKFKISFYRIFPSLAILFIIGLFPVLLAIGMNADFYDADRHILFVYPFICIFVTMLIQFLNNILNRIKLVLINVLTALLLIIPIASQISLYPYSYTYVNEIGLLFNKNKSITGWETDYWGVSLREAQESLAPNSLFHCSSNQWFKLKGGADQNHCNSSNPPIIKENYIFISPKRENYSPPTQCSEFNSTTRNFLTYKYQMNFVYTCPDPYSIEGGIP